MMRVLDVAVMIGGVLTVVLLVAGIARWVRAELVAARHLAERASPPPPQDSP